MPSSIINPIGKPFDFIGMTSAETSAYLKQDQTSDTQTITATDTAITASDEVYFGDVTDSSKLKKDTVQGILDLVPAPDLTGYLLTTGARDGATSQSQTFTNGITLSATSIVTDTTTGLKIGTATNQKLGFFNATPIVQVGATIDLGVVLSNLGLRAAGTAYTITTSGAVSFTGTIGLGNTITIANAKNIVLSTTTGTKIGTGTTQKLGFYNATPVVQQTATTDLGTALSNLGLRAAGTAYPITTSGAVTLTGATTVTLDSTTAFKVSSTTADILTADTTNGKVIIGGSVHELGITGDESMIVLTTDLVTINDTVNLATLTASKLVFTDASKNLTSTGIGTSAQFIKGDGSLDSSVYLTTGFVDRGNPSTYDFTVSSLTTDGTWRDLDLSSIVPAGAKSVALGVSLLDETAGLALNVRKKGNSTGYNFSGIFTQVANKYSRGVLFCGCDTDRLIQYLTTNSTFTTINITVLGWWL